MGVRQGILIVAATRGLDDVCRRNPEMREELKACRKIVSYDTLGASQLKGVGKGSNIYIEERAKIYMYPRLTDEVRQAELRGAKVVCLDS